MPSLVLSSIFKKLLTWALQALICEQEKSSSFEKSFYKIFLSYEIFFFKRWRGGCYCFFCRTHIIGWKIIFWYIVGEIRGKLGLIIFFQKNIVKYNIFYFLMGGKIFFFFSNQGKNNSNFKFKKIMRNIY